MKSTENGDKKPLSDIHLTGNIHRKIFLHFAKIICLTKHTHKLGHGCYRRHVISLDYTFLQGQSAGFIHRQIASLIQKQTSSQHQQPPDDHLSDKSCKIINY